LVVDLPLWKIWVRQLGWLFPIYGKIKAMFQTTNQIFLDDPSGTSLALRCGVSTRDTVAIEDFSWTPTLATCGWPWKSFSQQMIVSHSVSICSYDIPITLFSHHIFPSYPCDP
jgi:hypothetical protein